MQGAVPRGIGSHRPGRRYGGAPRGGVGGGDAFWAESVSVRALLYWFSLGRELRAFCAHAFGTARGEAVSAP